jgi:hypothetical protein
LCILFFLLSSSSGFLFLAWEKAGLGILFSMITLEFLFYHPGHEKSWGSDEIYIFFSHLFRLLTFFSFFFFLLILSPSLLFQVNLPLWSRLGCAYDIGVHELIGASSSAEAYNRSNMKHRSTSVFRITLETANNAVQQPIVDGSRWRIAKTVLG